MATAAPMGTAAAAKVSLVEGDTCHGKATAPMELPQFVVAILSVQTVGLFISSPIKGLTCCLWCYRATPASILFNNGPK